MIYHRALACQAAELVIIGIPTLVSISGFVIDGYNIVHKKTTGHIGRCHVSVAMNAGETLARGASRRNGYQ